MRNVVKLQSPINCCATRRCLRGINYSSITLEPFLAAPVSGRTTWTTICNHPHNDVQENGSVVDLGTVGLWTGDVHTSAAP